MNENLSLGQDTCLAWRLFVCFLLLSLCRTMGTITVPSLPGWMVHMSRAETTSTVGCACICMRGRGCCVLPPVVSAKPTLTCLSSKALFHSTRALTFVCCCHSYLTFVSKPSHRSMSTCEEPSQAPSCFVALQAAEHIKPTLPEPCDLH